MNPHLQALMGWWNNEVEGTTRMMEAIPADKVTEKVHERVRTLGELAAHITGSITDLANSLEQGNAVFGAEGGPVDDVAGLVAAYKAAVKDAQTRIQQLTDEQLNAHIPMEMNGEVVWNPTALEMLSGYIAHEIHHRGQMSVILRQVGAKVPGVYGPTGDDWDMP
ncbi:MAG: hypothetical protein D6675_10775 [Gemmatimonadetes bacterium]|nr:MAG: hypothetical protein D6675_10775 [Gemmatimonadota bacterium]